MITGRTRERNGNLSRLNILYLYRRASLSLPPSCQPMASRQIPGGSRIAYSCRSYHLVTWQEALDIIIYLYRVIPFNETVPPSASNFFHPYHFPFAHILRISNLFMQGICTNVYTPFLHPKQM